MYSIPDSDRALPKYKFKNTLQSRLLDILIQEDTYVGVRTLIDIFRKYYFFEFNFTQTLFHLPISKYRKIPKISPSKYKPPKLVTQKTLR